MEGLEQDQFSLKWNNYQSNLSCGLLDLLQEEDMVDVTIGADGKFLQAHKVILSVCSPYFRDLFKVNPCKHPIVILKDVGVQELSDMLDFMYRGEAHVRQEDMPSFLKLADTLKVKGLAGGAPAAPTPTTHQQEPKPPLRRSAPQPIQPIVKKKRLVEATLLEPDDPGESPPPSPAPPSQPRRKRRRTSTSPVVVTQKTKATVVEMVVPKDEGDQQETDTVEFLEEADETDDPLEEYMTRDKQGTSDAYEDTMDNMSSVEADETREESGSERYVTHVLSETGNEDTEEPLPPGSDSYYYMENQHGIPQLVHDGFVYRRDRERSRVGMNKKGESVQRIRTYWRCVIRQCRARCNVDPQNQLRISHDHNHSINEDAIKYRNLRGEIKKRALENTRETPREVLEYFGIEDSGLEKTIMNWRYRFTRKWSEPVNTLAGRRKTRISRTPVLEGEDSSEYVLQEGELLTAMVEGDADADPDAGDKVYYIISDK